MAKPDGRVWRRSGGEIAETKSPVDRAHLARQTMGDSGLEREVLGMFLRQIETLAARMRAADPAARRELAHALCGSARGIGAFALAETAAAIEADPQNAVEIEHLGWRIDEVVEFIAAYR